MKSLRPTGWKHMQLDAIGVGLLVAMSIAAFVLQVRPLFRAQQALAGQTAALTAEQQKLNKLKRSVQMMRTRLEAVQRSIDQTEFKLEPASQINGRLARLTEIASHYSLQVDEMEPGTPGKVTSGGQFETIPIRLSGRGGYRNCTQFLDALHQQLRDTSVTAMSLAAGDSADPNGAFTFNLLWHTAPAESPVKS
jgi:Tfp pilus assembly protein PilO